MSDVDTLSDDDLRTKLVEYGYPVMPITGTTRNIMVKKLKVLMESKGKSDSDRRSLGKFSSDDESDSDVKLIKKDKNRRITMAVTPMQQSKTSREEKQAMMPPPAAAPIQKEKRRTSAKFIVELKSSPDSNSDSEPEIVLNQMKKNIEIDVPVSKPKPISTPKYEPLVQEETFSVQSPESPFVSKIASPKSRYMAYGSPSYDVSEEMAKIRSRLSTSTRSEYMVRSAALSASVREAPEAADPGGAGEPVRFLSNFTRRLSASRNGSALAARADDDYGDYDDGGSASTTLYGRSKYTASSEAAAARSRSTTSRDYSKSMNEAEPRRTSNISFILIAVVALFFVVLAALYYGMHSGNAIAIDGRKSKYEPQDLF